jgi:hypothetical protein
VAAAPAPEVQVAEVVVSEVSEISVDDIPAEAIATPAPEPMGAGENAQSRERLIVAAPAVSLELDEPGAPEPAPVAAKAETPALAEVEVVLDEPVEEAPVSSRRAVVAAEPQERLAEMAFGAEEQPAPRHTPPPASGRLPAVPAEDEGDITGVREAGSLPLQPQPPAAALSAEPTPAQLSPSDKVAEVIASAQAFAPATFIALLDASLGL